MEEIRLVILADEKLNMMTVYVTNGWPSIKTGVILVASTTTLAIASLMICSNAMISLYVSV